MATTYASGKYALAECDDCGQTVKLLELKKLTVAGVLTGFKVCPDCWVPDHPQLARKAISVDAQALREPRPAKAPPDMRNVAWGWWPVRGQESAVVLGQVTVNTP